MSDHQQSPDTNNDDLDKVSSDPTYAKLELFIKLVNPVDPQKNRLMDTPDDHIVARSKEDVIHLTFLTELIMRVREGRIPLETLKSIYSEQDVKDQVMTCLNLRMATSEISEAVLTKIIEGLVNGNIIDASEIVLKSTNAVLTYAVKKLYNKRNSEPELPVFKRPSIPEKPWLFPPPPTKATIVQGAPEHAESADHIKLPLIIQYDENGKELDGCPLSGEREIYTIGTDISNDVVITDDYDNRVDKFHAELKIEDGKIFIRGRTGGGPLKVIKPGERQVVVKDWRQIDEEQQFMVGRLSGKNENSLPRFAVKLDQKVEKKLFTEYLRNRFKMLIREHAGEILLLLLRKNDKTKPRTVADDKKDTELDARIFALEGGFKQVLLEGAKYKLELFSQIELADVIKLARDPIHQWMSTHWRAILQQYGRDYLEYIESQRGKITKEGKPEDLEMELAFPTEFLEIMDMSDKYGMDAMTRTDMENQMRESTAKGMEAAEDIRSKAKARLQAQSIREADELEKSLRPIRNHQNALKEYKERYKGVHYMEGMETLDADTQFGYVGPVLIVVDTHDFRETVPFLLNRMTLGENPINTIELPKVIDRKRGTKPFMAEIVRDPGTGAFIINWMDGNIEFSTGEIPMTPTFEIPFDSKVRIGRYILTIEDHHAYTEKSIQGIAGQQGEELMEIIFDQWFSSQERNEEAYEELKELANKKYVDRRYVRQGMMVRMVQLWEEIGSWKIGLPVKPRINMEENNLTNGSRCIQDAQHLITLNYLLADSGHFLEKIDGISQSKVKDAAVSRMAAYIAANNESEKKDKVSLRSIALGIKRKFARQSREITKSEHDRANATDRAEVGKIQIARFLAAGFVTDGEIKQNPDISNNYLLKIQEVVTIRNLFDRLMEGGDGVDAIDELEQLCEGKKMKDIFSTDEILIINLNIELNVNEEYPLTQYLRNITGFVARECFRDAMVKADNAKELDTIKKMLTLKAINIMDLRIQPLITPELIQSQLDELLLNADQGKKRVERERKLKIRKHEILERAACDNDAKRSALVEKADKVGDTLELARVETKLEVLLAVADIMADKEVDTEMEEESIAMQTLRYQHNIPNGREAFSDRMEAIVAERRTITWQDMRKEYAELALKAARSAVAKVTNGEDATFNHLLLRKAAAKGIIDLNTLGLDEQKISKGREIEKEKRKQMKLEEKYAAQFEGFLSAPFEDFSYFDTIDLNTLTDETEKQYVKGIIYRISIDRMGIVLQNLGDGKDVVYMRLIARKLIRKGFDPKKYFQESDLAILEAQGLTNR